MAYSVTPLAGIDLTNLAATNANSAGTSVPTTGPLGLETFGSDGLRYVFAKAGETITASLATCSINVTTFVATASAGTYLSPATAMTSGDYGWFSKASV
tara:strand:+ start:201 stop:497 length:297 start_codon:yes stop_codon:yes gene_type:complete